MKCHICVTIVIQCKKNVIHLLRNVSHMKIRVIHNRRKSDGPAPVHIEVYISRTKRIYFHTGITIESSYWDGVSRSVKGHQRSIAFNHTIKQMLQKIYDYETKCVLLQKKITPDGLRQHIGKKVETMSFNDFMRDQVELDKKRLALSTYKSHLSIVTRLNEFGTILMDEFNRETIARYHNHFLSTMKQSTTAKPHKVIRKYVIRAVDLGYMKDNPYRQFKVPRERNRIIHLTTHELNQIRKYKGIDRLQAVRDMFLFQCLTGMAYIDMQQLKPADILQHGKMRYIEKHRYKVDRVPQLIPLMPEAERILKRYQGSDSCFPVISNQKMNAYLKEIAIIRKVDKPLTTHVARHTFATLMLEKGMPLEAISNMLGHASIKQTSIYAKIVISKIQNDMKRLNISSL